MSRGPAEREFVRAVRAYAASVRASMIFVAQAAAVLVTAADRLRPVVAALVVVTAWHVLTVMLARGRAQPWVLWADTALLCVLCLSQPVLDVPSLVRDDCGWVCLAVEAALIAHQWQFPHRPSTVAGVLVVAAYFAGAMRMAELPVTTILVTSAWLLFTAQVSRWIRNLMQQSASRADEASAAHEQAQREIEVADALRESEAAHLAMLHDTVAATLLMVGLGAARPGAHLRKQAAADLRVLTAASAPYSGDACDVAEQLATVIGSTAESGTLRVGFTRLGPATVLPRPVTEAFAGAVGESLRNVARHAGAQQADVELDTRQGSVRVRIRDSGGGFSTGAQPGRGIRLSITGRMERAGGRALVTSSPTGVVVDLHWTASARQRVDA